MPEGVCVREGAELFFLLCLFWVGVQHRIIAIFRSFRGGEDARVEHACNIKTVLCSNKKWVGQGGTQTLATAPDADILREIVCQHSMCEQGELLS